MEGSSVNVVELFNLTLLSDADLSELRYRVECEQSARKLISSPKVSSSSYANVLKFSKAKPLPPVVHHHPKKKSLRTKAVDMTKFESWEEARKSIISLVSDLSYWCVNVRGEESAALVLFDKPNDAKTAMDRMIAAGYKDTHYYVGELGTDVEWWKN